MPVETDFGYDPLNSLPAPPPPPPPPSPPTGLYMTAAHFRDDFEGWLKGDPEYEIHILGQSGGSDSLTSYQCAGEHAGGYYAFDQNDHDWSGNVLLFSQAQLNSYKAAHANQNVRSWLSRTTTGPARSDWMATGSRRFRPRCRARIPTSLEARTARSGLAKVFKRANALQKILRAAYSVITSQDDLIGNAIEDRVVGEFHAGSNWIVRGESNVTNGWLNLQMR